MNNARPLVIYHANCADGFAAAWVFHHAYRRTAKVAAYPEFVPGRYGYGPPDVVGRDVYLVDFSYPRDVVRRLVADASRVTLIDHHKSAIEDLAGQPGLRQFVDMNSSGATLAWDFLFPHAPRPLLLGHIEDRDLWRFKLPHTREISAAVFAERYSFATWDKLMAATAVELMGLTAQGAAMLRKAAKDLAELLPVVTRQLVIDGHQVHAANLPFTMASDAGHELAQRDPARFVAVYWDTPDHRQFSLRSSDSGMDVSLIAGAYGGGGHQHAAGFRVERTHPLAVA